MDIVSMYDTIHDTARNIPLSADKAAGYVTGTPDVQWTAADWGRLPRAGKVRIDQSPAGDIYAAGGADVYDMETGAGTPARFAAAVVQRISAGHGNAGYGSKVTLEQAAAELDRLPGRGPGWWHGHVRCWLAAPDLSLAEAVAMIGTTFAGFTIVAVQWATPRSNPGTQVPGGTLQSLNLDLSAAAADWFPAQPPPPDWQAHALQLAADLVNIGGQLQALLKQHL